MRYLLTALIAVLMLSSCHRSNPVSDAEPADTVNTDVLRLDIALENGNVRTGTLIKRTVNRTVRATGDIAIPPTDLVSVHARSEGFVRRIAYLPGDHVRKGSVLFTIEHPGLLEKQRAMLESKAQLAYAENEFDRKSALREGGAVSEGEYQKALAERDHLRARYNGLKEELKHLGVDVGALESNLAFQSEVSVRAPITGYIHEVKVNTGQMIRPEDQLMDIANNDHMHLELKIFSRDAPLIRVGQDVQFSIPGSAERLHAEVVKINPMLDPNTSTLQVHCHLADESLPSIRAGMFVNGLIEVSDLEVEGLPLDAVVKAGSKFYGYGLDDDRLVRTKLTNVRVFDDFVTFDPLPYGEMVTAGAYYLE